MKAKKLTARARQPAKILVVDDHPIVREALTKVIQQERDLRVCGAADDSAQALDLAATTKPDLAIVDLTLRQSHGLDLIKDLRLRHPRVAILVVSMHDESLYAERALRAGAHGYMNKQELTRNIIPAIRQVLAGDIYLSERLSHNLAVKMVGLRDKGPLTPLERLTDREMQVFHLIGAGQSVRQIADRLHLDLNTIKTYRKRIKEKLNLKDARDVLQNAIQWTHREGAP